MNNATVKGMVVFFGVCYLLFWGASGCTSWGQNGGLKCHSGYNPVTHLCADPPSINQCSGWSPPGFCWDVRR